MRLSSTEPFLAMKSPFGPTFIVEFAFFLPGRKVQRWQSA